ncbi:MAG: DUF5667 domain-containing protein [Anaerolineaceae bacterium]
MDSPQKKISPDDLERKLRNMNDIPVRDPQKHSKGKSRFLSQAYEIRKTGPLSQEQHPVFWNKTRYGKERKMTFTTIMLIFALVFGGSGGVVYAAQESMPEDTLYGVKLASEDVQDTLTFNQQSKVNLALAFANRRVEEMKALIEEGKLPPEALLARYQQQINLALQYAARLSDEAVEPAFLQIRTQLQQQDRTMEQLQLQQNINEEALKITEQVRSMAQNRIVLLENGLEDPLQFKNQLQKFAPEEIEPAGNQYHGSDDEIEDGQTLQGDNPWTDETPTPGSGYGEGNGGNPLTDETPIPGSGYGEGNGSNPWTDGTPTPGSGYGEPGGPGGSGNK